MSQSTGTGRIIFTGDKALADNLRAMNRAARVKAIRPAVAAAAKPMAESIRLQAPYRTGALKRSIDIKVKTYKNAVVAIIGPRADLLEVQTRAASARTAFSGPRKALARRVRPSKYAHLVEAGTVRSKANPFATRGFLLAAPASQAILETRIAENILGAIKEV